MAYFGCFLVLRKLLFVSFCVVVWVLFSVFSIFCITSLVSATPRNHPYFNKYVLLFLIKIVHKKLFENFQDEKELFLNYRKFDLFTSEKCIFPKGLTHNFGQKVKFF